MHNMTKLGVPNRVSQCYLGSSLRIVPHIEAIPLSMCIESHLSHYWNIGMACDSESKRQLEAQKMSVSQHTQVYGRKCRLGLCVLVKGTKRKVTCLQWLRVGLSHPQRIWQVPERICNKTRETLSHCGQVCRCRSEGQIGNTRIRPDFYS